MPPVSPTNGTAGCAFPETLSSRQSCCADSAVGASPSALAVGRGLLGGGRVLLALAPALAPRQLPEPRQPARPPRSSAASSATSAASSSLLDSLGLDRRLDDVGNLDGLGELLDSLGLGGLRQPQRPPRLRRRLRLASLGDRLAAPARRDARPAGSGPRRAWPTATGAGARSRSRGSSRGSHRPGGRSRAGSRRGARRARRCARGPRRHRGSRRTRRT